jgi:hypothetical protein
VDCTNIKKPKKINENLHGTRHLLIASAMAVVPACTAASHCKSCSTTTSTACTGCYNYKGHTGPRYLSAGACRNQVTAIENCKIYDDSLNAAATTKEGA